ncbi:holo-ACP synthase [Paenibacillus harenae]|uniref:holo-ACP synthase n=1 Tax=Paenibacillus harenae TaxID=306543 RepID=UPI0027944B17|nr:holo-ACP synthase [Paenibacillus harenae]MDQ0060461.1 holo-[acyl-carrier protein] synthase [Paenibacillus harenae]
MIVGIGHDLTDIERVTQIMNGRTGARFVERVLTVAERELSAGYSAERLRQFTAGRFAAKEAVVKALGCGIGATVGFADISIGRDECGKPICTLSEQAWRRLGQSAAEVRIHVTITHERTLASAFVVAERI